MKNSKILLNEFMAFFQKKLRKILIIVKSLKSGGNKFENNKISRNLNKNSKFKIKSKVVNQNKNPGLKLLCFLRYF